MSYILDALRKADSERERGTVPTLHSHPGHAEPGTQARLQAQGGPAWGRGAAAAGLVILLLAAGFLVAQWLRPEPALPASPAAPVQDAVAAAPARQAPLTPTLLAPPPAAVEALPDTKPNAAPPPASAAAAAIVKLTELPEATRKALPAIVTSGAMYSDTPANRMLIINGQLLHEGDKIAPELLLERIELKSAVLVYKGQRFRINY